MDSAAAAAETGEQSAMRRARAADAERIPLVIVRAQLGGDAGIWGAYALSREG